MLGAQFTVILTCVLSCAHWQAIQVCWRWIGTHFQVIQICVLFGILCHGTWSASYLMLIFKYFRLVFGAPFQVFQTCVWCSISSDSDLYLVLHFKWFRLVFGAPSISDLCLVLHFKYFRLMFGDPFHSSISDLCLVNHLK